MWVSNNKIKDAEVGALSGMIIHLVVRVLHVKVGHQSIGKVLIAVGHRVAAHVAPAPQAVYQAYAKWTNMMRYFWTMLPNHLTNYLLAYAFAKQASRSTWNSGHNLKIHVLKKIWLPGRIKNFDENRKNLLKPSQCNECPNSWTVISLWSSISKQDQMG